ncbi:MAG TPA: DUF1800 domain-containing protein [Thermoanaerobaculia bacterium]
MSRRGLLKGAAGAGIASAALLQSWPVRALQAAEPERRLPIRELAGIVPRVAAPADPVAHLLHRTTFGIRPGELERARQMGIASWLDEQLAPEGIDDSEVDAQVGALFPTLTRSAQELLDIADQQSDGGYSVAMELKRATLYRHLFSQRQLYEVMVEFWNNHFSMYHFKDDVSVLKTIDDRAVSRALALGRFRDLLMASAHSPAMMVYLDNQSNVADGPNENYARELMELHTVGVDAGYTQQDVHEVARCFTGWTVDYNDQGTNGEFLFDPGSHDAGPKVVLGVAIAGSASTLDGRRVLEILARHPSCARFISTKLCRRFVADVPPTSVVDKAAATFSATGGDIRAVLRTILLSDEFFASAGQKLRRPYEFHVAALRVLGARVSTADGLDNLIWPLYSLGQVPFEWEPPNGYPDVGAAWANTNGLLNRWNLAAALALNWFDGVQVPMRGFAGRTGARTPAQLVDAVAALLLQRGIDEPDRSRLIDYVAQGRPAGGRVAPWYLNQQAPGLVSLVLGSPYFQWR